MKKLLIILSCAISLASCTGGIQKPKEKSESKKLAEFFLSYDEYSANNDIQKDELYEKRETNLMLYQDSIGIFNNLEGTITQLEVSDFRGAKILNLEIEVPIKQEYDKITFRIIKGINPDSLKTNKLYLMVKDLPKFGKVYFDGAISQNVNNGMPHNERTSESIRFPYPYYDFHLTNISTNPCDTIGQDLRNAIIAGRKSVNNIFKEYRKEAVTSKEEDTKEFNKLKDLLNEKDKSYLENYMVLIASDIER